MPCILVFASISSMTIAVRLNSDINVASRLEKRLVPLQRSVFKSFNIITLSYSFDSKRPPKKPISVM